MSAMSRLARAGSLPIWTDPTPLRVLGMGTALPGEPVGTAALLDLMQARFGLGLRGRGMAAARRGHRAGAGAEATAHMFGGFRYEHG